MDSTFTKKPKRILLKLSWEALMWDGDYGIDVKFLQKLAEKIVYLSKYAGLQVAIVVWGGNIFRGVKWASQGMNRAYADYMGMLATAMNAIALGDAIEKQGQDVRVMSAVEMHRIAEPFIQKRALKHLNKWRVIILAWWTGNPYFTTDSAAVLRGLELGCDYVVKATKVDGIYDKDPVKHPDAKKFDVISLDEALKRGLRVMDQAAIALAADEWIPIFVCNINDVDKIWSQLERGTYVVK